METLDSRQFLSSLPPFDTLTALSMQKVLDHIDIHYYKQNDTICTAGKEPEFYFVIGKGIVKELDELENDTFYSKGDSFDAASLIQDKLRNSYVAEEESILFAIPKAIFMELIQSEAAFESYYLTNISDKMQQLMTRNINKDLATFMATRVSETYINPAVFVEHTTPIYDAVKKMSEQQSDSLIITFPDQNHGIVTHTDLREKVILQNRAYQDPIGEIAIRNLISIDKSDFLFNALLSMIERSIQRIVVKDGETILGVLEQVSLLSTVTSKAHLVNVMVQKAKTVEELGEAAGDIVHIIKSLQQKGVKVRHITKLLADLNTKIYKRLFEILAPKELIDNSCLIVLGSEGRKEQTLRTDQDNALIIRDGYTHPDIASITQTFTDTLLSFGFPKCEGNIMVCNPSWCKPYKEFEEEAFGWINQPSGENIINLAILYDAGYVCGDAELVHMLKSRIYNSIHDNKAFFAHFSMPVLMFDTPLSMFANFVTEKKEHKDELDIKKGAIFPIVHGVRAMAFETQCESTNTFERIKELNNRGIISRELATELMDSFDFLLTLRLENQLSKFDHNKKPDNYLNPQELSKFQRDVLRDVFKIVDRFKKYITHHFNLNMVS